jgi:hypothetical protein
MTVPEVASILKLGGREAPPVAPSPSIYSSGTSGGTSPPIVSGSGRSPSQMLVGGAAGRPL